MLHHIFVIFKKQVRDTLKNKTVLIQFLMFPVMTAIMCNAIKLDGMPANFFVFLFGSMYVGMAPLVSTSAIMAEEKEKGIVRLLQMMNIKPWEYLLGIGSYVFAICILCSAVFPLCGEYTGQGTWRFMLFMAVGIVISTLIGSAVGMMTKNQMAASSVAIPVMMVFAFLPMIGLFNERVEKIANYTYSGQIQRILATVDEQVEWKSLGVLLMNFIVAVAVFAFAYSGAKKEG